MWGTRRWKKDKTTQIPIFPRTNRRKGGKLVSLQFFHLAIWMLCSRPMEGGCVCICLYLGRGEGVVLLRLCWLCFYGV